MVVIQGTSASGGYVSGKIRVIHRQDAQEKTVRDGISESDRLDAAVSEAASELDRLYENALKKVGESSAQIFEIHKMMLEDEDFIGEARNLTEGGFDAETAVKSTAEHLAQSFRSMESAYMQARAADVEGLAARLCEILTGRNGGITLTEPSIVAADDLTPAETILLERSMVLGFVTERGSEMSHTAILARMMGIPAIVGAGRALSEYDGMTAILDGDSGRMWVDPDEEVSQEYRRRIRQSEEELARLELLRGKKCWNSSGERVLITANVGELDDVDEAVRWDCDGVGLFRTEFLFMRRSKPPTEEEQYEIYRSAAEKLGGAECVVRTLDAGADKRISYLTGDASEANPALGIRAVRLCLKMPELLLTQFRALYRAAAVGNISAMIPMITLPSEVERVREIAAEARASLERDGIPWGRMKVGIMIETPSAAILADLLAPMVDFFSIGTNDLIQYTIAADRENPGVAYLSTPLPESVRRCIKMTCAAARREGIPVCVCGELGADPAETRFFLESGVTKLSVAPPKILKVRESVMASKFSRMY
ncbi:MAG: phosphoenolpyruvate--protein phosphotransferase [Clostridia bacterium]|nr:phosphoenolpyruvate--protein phosphotransferase [Clostridia bacterium]MBQ8511726.1 phosphoenolpyruvate--protein phosphotransferase [Clostridia bacterium]